MPDLDQVKDFRQSQTPSSNKTSTLEQNTPINNMPAKNNGLALFLGFVSLLGLAAGGYTLHQQNLKTQAKLFASEQRIIELERALSATGEEMGESAGAMRAKLTALSERTEELWTQMDKLWASAWRRNQSEIQALQKQADKLANTQTQHAQHQSDATEQLKALSGNQADTTLKLTLLQDQLQAAENLKQQITLLSADLDKLKSQSQGRDKKQLEIGSSIAQIEMTQNALVEQLDRLENKITTTHSIATTSEAKVTKSDGA